MPTWFSTLREVLQVASYLVAIVGLPLAFNKYMAEKEKIGWLDRKKLSPCPISDTPTISLYACSTRTSMDSIFSVTARK